MSISNNLRMLKKGLLNFQKFLKLNDVLKKTYIIMRNSEDYLREFAKKNGNNIVSNKDLGIIFSFFQN